MPPDQARHGLRLIRSRPHGSQVERHHESPLVLRDEPSWDGRVEDVPEHERVWQAVLSLPRRQRAVTVLRYYEDMSEAQIAETLGIAPGTVKSHSHAAGHRLAELLGEPTALPAEEATP